jgi:hypothetical protein
MRAIQWHNSTSRAPLFLTNATMIHTTSEGRGLYNVYATLAVPPNVELRGANDGHTYQGAAMSVLAGRGSAQLLQTVVRLSTRSGVRGLAIVFPDRGYRPLMANRSEAVALAADRS